jgi:hypothetical protein
MKIILLNNNAGLDDEKVVTSADAELLPIGISLGITTGARWDTFHRAGSTTHRISEIAPGFSDQAEHEAVRVGFDDDEEAQGAEVVFIAENEAEEAALKDVLWHQMQEKDQITLLGVKREILMQTTPIGQATA